MFFVTISEVTYNPEDGRFADLHLELMPISTSDKADKALYAELWHRLRKHRFFLDRKNGEECDFAASLYFVAGTTETGHIPAIVAVNNVDHIKIDYETAEKTARKTLRHLDNLLRKLIIGGQDREALEAISDRIAAGEPQADLELKEYLKPFCRGNGLFVDERDFYRALDQEKARRKKKHAAARASVS